MLVSIFNTTSDDVRSYTSLSMSFLAEPQRFLAVNQLVLDQWSLNDAGTVGPLSIH